MQNEHNMSDISHIIEWTRWPTSKNRFSSSTFKPKKKT